MDSQAVADWLAALLAEKGADILRTKGIVDAVGHDDRLVFQAVHMLLEGDFHTAWPPGPRQSRIVLIGRNLDEPALAAGFAACAAP
jgi:G3E family GTPase